MVSRLGGKIQIDDRSGGPGASFEVSLHGRVLDQAEDQTATSPSPVQQRSE
jgi:hypothetical protein